VEEGGARRVSMRLSPGMDTEAQVQNTDRGSQQPSPEAVVVDFRPFWISYFQFPPLAACGGDFRPAREGKEPRFCRQYMEGNGFKTEFEAP